jgi:hypothetical protein
MTLQSQGSPTEATPDSLEPPKGKGKAKGKAKGMGKGK